MTSPDASAPHLGSRRFHPWVFVVPRAAAVRRILLLTLLLLGVGEPASLRAAGTSDISGDRIVVPSGVADASIHLHDAPLLSSESFAHEAYAIASGAEREPQSLGVGDLDEDGVPDLVVGSRVQDSGIVTLYRGNADAIYPNSRRARRRRANGFNTDAPFLSRTEVAGLSQPPHFLGVGDFDADGHLDLVIANLGSTSLSLLAGDGRGGLRAVGEIELPGGVTSLIAGEIYRRDGLTDVVVTTRSGETASLLVFRSPRGALAAAPAIFSLPDAVSQLALGQLDDHSAMDLAIVAGGELFVLAGEGRPAGESQGVVESVTMAFDVKSVAVGDFVRGTVGRDELAIQAADGSIHVLGRDFDAEEVSPGSGYGAKTRMLAAHIASVPGDQLLLLDEMHSQIEVILFSDSPVTEGAAANRPSPPPPFGLAGATEAAITAAWRSISRADESSSAGSSSSLLYPHLATVQTPGEPLAVIPLRSSPDAIDDLVILLAGHSEPVVAKTEADETVVVDSTTDVLDGNVNSITELIADPGTDLVISLREAITAANNTPGMDSIHFDIPIGTDLGCDDVSGVCTIQPGAAGLPTITVPVNIDGTTQPSFVDTPVIELDGSLTGANVAGLAISGGSSLVRGLVVNRFANNSDVVAWFAGGNIIEGNFFGVDPTGTADQGTGDGLHIFGIAGNTIGGTTPEARNLISGHENPAVALNGGATSNFVQGNFVGTDITGTIALGNTGNDMLVLDTSANNTVGGTTAGTGNLFSGGPSADYPSIGFAFDAPGNLLQGNLIGTDVTGTGDLGHAGIAIAIVDSQDTTIGGDSPSAGNTIAHNGSGIELRGLTSTGNSIFGNSIFDNDSLAIDLCADAGSSGCNDTTDVTPNDPGDPDTGPNNLQNFPVLTSAVMGSTVVDGTLNSLATTTFRVDLYANSECDPTGYGEGELYLGSDSITTDSSGDAAFTAIFGAVVPIGDLITATATDPDGNTSEMSQCVAVTVSPDLIFYDGLESGDTAAWSESVP